MEQELIFVKKGKASQNDFAKPMLKLETRDWRFIINKEASKLLNVDVNDGLMFAFNLKEKTAYLIKDDEDDAFKLSRKDDNSFRFSSKNLVEHFDQIFGLFEKGDKTFRFKVNPEPNEKGYYSLSILYGSRI